MFHLYANCRQALVRTLILKNVAWLQDSVAIELGELAFAADNEAI